MINGTKNISEIPGIIVILTKGDEISRKEIVAEAAIGLQKANSEGDDQHFRYFSASISRDKKVGVIMISSTEMVQAKPQ